MFNNLLGYYLKNAQIRINQRIESINEQRVVLKKSGDKKYKGLTTIKNSHLYSNKSKIIKEIRESDSEILKEKLTLTIAEALKDNIKLKPDYKTKSSDELDELAMKKDNLEFISLQELLWGIDESYTVDDKFNFLLHLFLDLEHSDEYSLLVHETLINYIPFARYLAMEKAIDKYDEFRSMLAPEYKNTNVDVFAEAVYELCMTYESDEIMERFVNFLKSSYTYESKDSNKRYLLKEEEIHFQNFIKALSQNLDTIIEPLSRLESNYSLGKRVYDIIIDDFEIDVDLMNYGMSRSPESYGHYLTASGSPDVDVMSELLEASERYVDKLIQIQQEFSGNIEREYFKSELFSVNATPYYSEDRFSQLFEQKQIEEFEEKYSLEIIEDFND